jgi:hypothetical protein
MVVKQLKNIKKYSQLLFNFTYPPLKITSFPIKLYVQVKREKL